MEQQQQQQKFEDDTGEMEIIEDYVVLDDATTGAGSHLDLSNLRKRKTKIISSAKETIENGEYCAKSSVLGVMNIFASEISFPCIHDKQEGKAFAIAENASKAEVKNFSRLRHRAKRKRAKKKINVTNIKMCASAERKNRNTFSLSAPFTSDTSNF